MLKELKILKQPEVYKIPFQESPVQEKILKTPHMNLAQRRQAQVEINNMLKKGTICKYSHLK